MRDFSTYRGMRRLIAKKRAKEIGVPFTQYWPTCGMRDVPAPAEKHRPVPRPKGIYAPHQSKRQAARYARQMEGQARG